MTCIVGLVHRGAVYMGADSAGVGPGWDHRVRIDRKIYRNGEFLIGFTTSWRMGQLLGYAFRPPALPEGKDFFAYLVTDFIDAARICLKAGGYAERVNEGERSGDFLVATRGRIFRVGGDYQVGENAMGFDACGCGDQAALGNLLATKHLKPEPRLKLALEAAEMLSAGVRGPFHFEALGSSS